MVDFRKPSYILWYLKHHECHMMRLSSVLASLLIYYSKSRNQVLQMLYYVDDY